MTSADVHDTLAFASVVVGDEAVAYADRAYDSAHNRAALADAGIKNRIMHKAARNGRSAFGNSATTVCLRRSAREWSE